MNYALKDIVEASAAATQRCCEIHVEDHPATNWCFDCEQGMCDEALLMHSRTRGTKLHQTSKIGSQFQVTRRQVLCSTHSKELDLVCTHESHPPRVVCISCMVTSHQSHPCVTVTDYFVGKQAEVQEMLVRAKVAETKLFEGAAAVTKEKLSMAANKNTVVSAINSYFVKAHIELDNRQKQLVTELEIVTKSKERILQQQEEGLLATVDGIRKESQQLQLALGATSQAKALVLMEQLGQHLSSIDELDFRPRELAEMCFHQAPLVLPEIHLVDATASGATVTSTGYSFPVVLSTLIPLGRFEITGGEVAGAACQRKSGQDYLNEAGQQGAPTTQQ